MRPVGNDPGERPETAEDFEDRIRGMAPAEAEAARKAGPRTYKPPDETAKFRNVQGVVETGKFKGIAGTLYRDVLRPIE